MAVIHLERQQVNGIVREIISGALGESFTGYKVRVETGTSCRVQNFWDEGNKDDAVLVAREGMRIVQWELGAGFEKVDIPQGFVLVVKEYRGTRTSIKVVVHPDDMAGMELSKSQSDLTQDEKIVLYATRSYKSSYGGVKNYRWHEACRNTGISLDRWETAKAALIDRKLLKRNGAIAVSGKNAIEGVMSWGALQ